MRRPFLRGPLLSCQTLAGYLPASDFPLYLLDFTHLPVDPSDPFGPLPAVAMLHLQDILERPMEMVGDVSYLLVQLIEGVARYSPTDANSTSNV